MGPIPVTNRCYPEITTSSQFLSQLHVNTRKTQSYWTLALYCCTQQSYVLPSQWHSLLSADVAHGSHSPGHRSGPSAVPFCEQLEGILVCLLDSYSFEHDNSCFAAWRFVITITTTVIEPRDIFITVTTRNSVLLQNCISASRIVWTVLQAFGNYLQFETTSIKYRNFLGAFAKLRKATIIFVMHVCLSVCPSACLCA